jgi:large conductance mechanosensitive channel
MDEKENNLGKIKRPSMRNEFMEFLREYKILTLAIAFIMGAASVALVNALVKDILMPIISPLLGASWKDATLTIGSVNILYGDFISEAVNFIILALIVFIIAKKVFKLEKVEK